MSIFEIYVIVGMKTNPANKFMQTDKYARYARMLAADAKRYVAKNNVQ